MKILAIDQATKTGYAHNCFKKINSGVADFKPRRGDSPGMRFINFKAWLSELVKSTKPELIIYEQEHHRGGAPTAIALGLIAMISVVATENNCDITSAHTGKVKKWATGNGRASKEEMVAAAKKLGFKPEDDNEADALLILLWYLDQFKPIKITRRKK